MSIPTRDALRVHGGAALSGTARVPPDLEVLERALLLASLATDRSQLTAPDDGSRTEALITVLRALGVPIARQNETWIVDGVGLRGLSMPSGPLDCARSMTSLAMISGLLCAQRFGTRVTVRESLGARSVENIVGPLRARGAHVAGQVTAKHAHPTPPISVAPLVEGEALHGLDCTLAAPDAPAKAALLISALYAEGSTTIEEPLVSPDHMERLLVALGLPLKRIGSVVNFDPSGWDRTLPGLGTFHAPGCVTCAAFACAAALLTPGSRIALGGVGSNPSRTGFFDALRLWNAPLQLLPRGDVALREPTQDVIARHGAVRGGVLGGELLLRARTELPALAVVATAALRETQLHDLIHAASDSDPQAERLEALLRAFSIDTTRHASVLSVRRTQPRATRVRAHDDTELAMAAVVLGLTAAGETVVEEGAAAIAQEHPGFLDMLRSLGARIEHA